MRTDRKTLQSKKMPGMNNTEFENDYDRTSFNWRDWNERGIALARRLKNEVGNRFLVEYQYPFEDPMYAEQPRLEISE